MSRRRLSLDVFGDVVEHDDPPRWYNRPPPWPSRVPELFEDDSNGLGVRWREREPMRPAAAGEYRQPSWGWWEVAAWVGWHLVTWVVAGAVVALGVRWAWRVFVT